MKYYIVIIPVLLFSSLFSQSCVPFVEQSLAPSLRGLMDTHPVDLDNDGDIDIVTASFKDDKVAWFENIGGTSFALHIVHLSQASGLFFQVLVGSTVEQHTFSLFDLVRLFTGAFS